MFIKFKWYVIFIINIIFLSIISISLYKLLCRQDLDIFKSFVNYNFLFYNFYENWFFDHIYINNLDDIYFFSVTNIFFIFESILDISILNMSDTNVNIPFLYSLVDNHFCNNFIPGNIYKYIDIIEIKFFTKVNSFTHIEFYCLQDSIFLISNDTTLIFFRISTFNNKEVSCIVIFLVSPNNLISSLTKLQCFCFDNLFISTEESIDLPVIFNLDFNFIFFINKKMNLLFFYLLLER